MKNIMKLVFGLMFTLAFMVTAKAQTDTGAVIPSPDDIVCVQVDENVFECSILDPNFSEGAPGLEEFEQENQMEPGLDTAGVDEGFMDEDDPAVREFEFEEDTATGQLPSLDTGMIQEDQVKECEMILEDQVKECEKLLENQDQSKGIEQEQFEMEPETQDEELMEDPSVREETPELEEGGTTAPHHDSEY